MGPETPPVDNCSVPIIKQAIADAPSPIGEKGAEVEFECPAFSRLHILLL